MIRAIAAFILSIWMAGATWAQDAVWVQVEAQPTLGQAQTRVRAYAGQFDNVAGFALGTRWYGIVLGPYAPANAEALLTTLRRSGQIPQDAFIADGGQFRQQFWPIGVGAQTTAQPLPEGTVITPVIAPDVTPGVTPDLTPNLTPDPVQIADETPAQARTSEATLTRPEREALQVMLRWAGFYDGPIDGAYGRGTRGSMEQWQVANNYPPTGILTTAQRAELLAAYNAVLDGLDLQLVRDDAAGIAMQLPTGAVQFARYDPPFVHYDAKGDIPAQVLLISQAGDQSRLFGLYEILQTLAIVPPEGPRARGDSSFELEGINDTIHSYTYAALENGQIKGFTLVWPAGDEERRTRLLANMTASFTRLDGVLDPGTAAPTEDQAIDLVSGLEVRKPRLSRSGFYIDAKGGVLTTTEAVDQCARISLDAAHDATVVLRDDNLGIAVLRPDAALSPISVAAFQTGVPRIMAEVAVGGYPYGEVLVTPSVTFGKLADIRGLNGEAEIKRLALTMQPGDAGGPVFDSGGAVLGMLLPRAPVDGQVLPPEVSFSVDSEAIIGALQGAGIGMTTTDTLAYMPPETLAVMAADVTVLVSCW